MTEGWSKDDRAAGRGFLAGSQMCPALKVDISSKISEMGCPHAYRSRYYSISNAKYAVCERGGVAPAIWADVDIVPECSEWDGVRVG